MLCPFCGFYSNNDDAVCPDCGKLLPRGENRDTGVMAIRQGKKAREEAASDKPPIWMERQGIGRTYIDPEVRPTADGQVPVYASPEVFEADGTPLNDRVIDRREGYVYGEQNVEELQGMSHAHRNRRSASIGRRGINWSLVLVIIAVMGVAAVAGGLLWLTQTDGGQRFIVRRDGFRVWDVEDADTEAIWYVAEEQAMTGDFDTAIRNYETARRLDEENEEVNVSGLMSLAEAYVAVGRTADAEEIYTYLYTDVVPTRADAYANEIRIMLADNRKAEAAVLMQTAYQKTKDETFNRDRASILPSQPVADRIAGLFVYRITLRLESPEQYPIYYVINNTEAKLPEEGTLYDAEKGLLLDEGAWQIRAVCVNNDLISDEWSGIYRIDLPRPFQPRANLAPNTYSKTQYVKLFPSKDETDPNVTIYYTIDGSIPDSDSPVYDGTAIKLPNGNSTLKAVAVNRNGKAGNQLEITYKIAKKPEPPKAYVSNDPKDVGSVKLNSTTYEAFVKEFGEEESREDVTLDYFRDCLRCRYSWGYVTYQRVAGTRYLIEISYSTPAIKAPRNTAVGMSMNDVVAKFRDMGQVESASGNRGLYSNDDGTGKIYYNKEDGTRIVRYVAYTADGHRWRLDYNISADGTVTSIYQLYMP